MTPDYNSLTNFRNSIVFFRAPQFHNKFEPNSVTFKGSTQEELTKFIKNNWYEFSFWVELPRTPTYIVGAIIHFRHGLVGHRKTDNLEEFGHPNVIVYYTIDYVNNAKQTNYYKNRILQVAKDNTDFKFAISHDEDFRLELEKYGQTYLGEEPLVTAHDKDGRKFKMATEFSLVCYN